MHPRGIHIGERTLISFGSAVLSHDFVGERLLDIYIGSYCFIGAHALILPGIRIGDHCVIGAGAVVTQDIPSHSLAAGNPARILRSDIDTGSWGILEQDFIARERKSEARS
jgi:acetyltransferase-like isoleucine patch superfamily enzyme